MVKMTSCMSAAGLCPAMSFTPIYGLSMHENSTRLPYFAEIAAIDAVLDIDVDSEIIINRVASRRVCPACGHSQSVREGEQELCAKCGGELVQRADDTPERMRHRLDVYRERTLPLINYYTEREKLVPIDGARSIYEVRDQIFGFMDGMIAEETHANYRTDEE